MHRGGLKNDEYKYTHDGRSLPGNRRNCREIADDSRFLNRLNHSTDRWGAWKCWCNSSIKGKVHNAWLKLGIDTKLDACATGKAGGRNKYYLNGVEITQAQARQHAMEVTGHYITNSEWK